MMHTQRRLGENHCFLFCTAKVEPEEEGEKPKAMGDEDEGGGNRGNSSGQSVSAMNNGDNTAGGPNTNNVNQIVNRVLLYYRVMTATIYLSGARSHCLAYSGFVCVICFSVYFLSIWIIVDKMSGGKTEWK